MGDQMTLKARIYECEVCGAEFRLAEGTKISKCACGVIDAAATDEGIIVAMFLRLSNKIYAAEGLSGFTEHAGTPNPMYGVAICDECRIAVREALARRKTLAAMAGDPPARAWEKG
jgi:hypothetical protein